MGIDEIDSITCLSSVWFKWACYIKTLETTYKYICCSLLLYF